MQSDVCGSVPFLRQHGLAEGLTKHHVDGSAYRRLFGCVRVPVELPLTPEILARAAMLVVPEGVISHQSAARLHGGVVPDEPRTHLTVGQARQRRRREGLRVHVGADLHTVTRGLLVVTNPAQTFCDLADELSLVDLVVCGDSMIHRGCLSIDAALDAARTKPTGAVTMAQRAADLVRFGAESPMESRTRLMLLIAGLPEPVVNMSVHGDSGAVIYRLDLSYPELRLAVEYDGRQHAEDSHQWGHDLTRREWFDDRGWRLVVVRATDVYDTPWETVRRIAAVMAARGYEKSLAANPPAGFALHFPGRPWKSGRAS